MRGSRAIAGVMLVLGLWAVGAPYLGPSLGLVVETLARTEFLTHVVPAVPVVLVALYAVVTGRFPLTAALLALLCGFWMAGTHVPLVLQATNGGVDWPSALWHSVPTLGTFLLTAAITTVVWLEERDREREAARG